MLKTIRDEFRKSADECLDTAMRIEKRLSLGVDLGDDRMLAAHYRKSLQHYEARCFALDAALEVLAVPDPLASDTGQGWQPIETAPKDGTTILVFKHTAPIWDVIGLAFWFGEGNISGWMSYGIPRISDEPTVLGLAHPTHWMPLPSAPLASSSAPQGEKNETTKI